MDTAYKLSYQITICYHPDYGIQDNWEIPKSGCDYIRLVQK